MYSTKELSKIKRVGNRLLASGIIMSCVAALMLVIALVLRSAGMQIGSEVFFILSAVALPISDVIVISGVLKKRAAYCYTVENRDTMSKKQEQDYDEREEYEEKIYRRNTVRSLFLSRIKEEE